MKITAFNGAMRGEKSITALMIESFFEGAKSAGADTEHVVLVKKKINHCLACLRCWLKTPGRCVQKDDGNELLDIFMDSDVVVFASPVYVENVTGLAKDFMDRLIPLSDPRFEPAEDGLTRHWKRFENYPSIMAMSNSGFVEPDAFAVLELMFPRIARSMNAKYIGGIFKGGGGMLGLDEPALQPMIEDYKALLIQGGKEVATNGRLTEETMSTLNAQVVPTDVYNQQVNMLWERLMK